MVFGFGAIQEEYVMQIRVLFRKNMVFGLGAIQEEYDTWIGSYLGRIEAN